MAPITNSGSSLFSGFTGLFTRAFSGVGSLCGKAVTTISSAASPITNRIPFSFSPITTRFNAMPKLGKITVVVLTVGAVVAVAHKVLSKKTTPAPTPREDSKKHSPPTAGTAPNSKGSLDSAGSDQIGGGD